MKCADCFTLRTGAGFQGNLELRSRRQELVLRTSATSGPALVYLRARAPRRTHPGWWFVGDVERPARGSPAQAHAGLLEPLRTAIEKGQLAVLLFASPAAARLLLDQGEVERAVELYALFTRYRYAKDWCLFGAIFGREIAAAGSLLAPERLQQIQTCGRTLDLITTAKELLAEFAASRLL